MPEDVRHYIIFLRDKFRCCAADARQCPRFSRAETRSRREMFRCCAAEAQQTVGAASARPRSKATRGDIANFPFHVEGVDCDQREQDGVGERRAPQCRPDSYPVKPLACHPFLKEGEVDAQPIPLPCSGSPAMPKPPPPTVPPKIKTLQVTPRVNLPRTGRAKLSQPCHAKPRPLRVGLGSLFTFYLLPVAL